MSLNFNDYMLEAHSKLLYLNIAMTFQSKLGDEESMKEIMKYAKAINEDIENTIEQKLKFDQKKELYESVENMPEEELPNTKKRLWKGKW